MEFVLSDEQHAAVQSLASLDPSVILDGMFLFLESSDFSERTLCAFLNRISDRALPQMKPWRWDFDGYWYFAPMRGLLRNLWHLGSGDRNRVLSGVGRGIAMKRLTEAKLLPEYEPSLRILGQVFRQMEFRQGL